MRAVYHGRVVYADWLSGLGLLTIVDHGDGYLSLYGHNERLYKEVGERVAAGDTIATVGDSGGRAAPALYFEIRKGGRPGRPAALVPQRSSLRRHGTRKRQLHQRPTGPRWAMFRG